jgi:hypothetical protein
MPSIAQRIRHWLEGHNPFEALSCGKAHDNEGVIFLSDFGRRRAMSRRSTDGGGGILESGRYRGAGLFIDRCTASSTAMAISTAVSATPLIAGPGM